VNRNAFLIGCLEYADDKPEEHLLIGYGFRHGSTTKVESLHHIIGQTGSVHLPDAVAHAMWDFYGKHEVTSCWSSTTTLTIHSISYSTICLTLQVAQRMANHESSRTTGLYDGTTIRFRPMKWRGFDLKCYSVETLVDEMQISSDLVVEKWISPNHSIAFSGRRSSGFLTTSGAMRGSASSSGISGRT
jgi:hypothetical protein